MVKLSDDEQAAMDALKRCTEYIYKWKLRGNQAELTAAIHVIQGFIVQRMLHRIDPEQWSSWYETGESPQHDPEGQQSQVIYRP